MLTIACTILASFGPFSDTKVSRIRAKTELDLC